MMNSEVKLPNGQVCENPRDVKDFWLRRGRQRSGFDVKRESVWIITVNKDRHFLDCWPMESRFFRSPILFADEVLNLLKGVEEFIVLHNRPALAPIADVDSKARARALILAGRVKECWLLDYLLIGVATEEFPNGWLSLNRVRGFRADDPFPLPKSKTRT